MDSSSSNNAAVSHSLHLDSNSSQELSQSAAGDGTQVEIRTMDSSVYKAAADGDMHTLRQVPEIDLQQQLSPKQNSVLHIAAQFGQLRTVRWILRFPWSTSLLQQQNLKGDFPLHLAAREGRLLVVKALCKAAAESLAPDIESGISPKKAMLRSTNKEGDTALHEAVRYNRRWIVKFLIKEDSDLFVYAENVSGGTPLYMAAERGFRELVEMIIDDSSTPPAYSGFFGRSALHATVIQNDKVPFNFMDISEMTEKILKWKPELTKEVDEGGWSPLHYGAYLCCETTIIRELLDNSEKCVPYLRIKDGNLTALHIAAALGHTKIVEILASRYPDCCEQVDDKGNNVYHLAVMSTRPRAVSSLKMNRRLRTTGLMNEKNGEGDTYLHLLHSSFSPAFVGGYNVDKMAFNNQKLTAVDTFLMAHDTCTCKEFLLRRTGEKGFWPCIGPKWWFRKKNDDSSITSRSQGNNVVRNKNEEGCKWQKDTDGIKKCSEIHLLVATLIATVAFAGGFTLPGGYDQSNGMAMLSKKASFRAFVVMDTLAMVLSVSAVFNYLFMSLHSRRRLLQIQVNTGFYMNVGAMAAMVIAFMTGLYAVLPHSGIPIFICVICWCFFLFFYFTCYLFFRRHRARFLPKKQLPVFPWLL